MGGVMSEQQRCSNCRLYLPPGEYPEGTCIFPLSKLPFWVEAFAQDAVEPDDGEHCLAWEAKP